MANTPMQSPVSRRNVLTAGALMTGLGNGLSRDS
jgi:hypothetical protein